MPVTTARQRVLAYLRKQRAASAGEVSRALDMTPANVRHHLSILLSDGRIAIAGERRGGGRGRPAKIYGLSENLLGNNLAPLSDGLLDELLGRLSSVRREDVLRALARRLGAVSQRGKASDASQTPNMAKRLALAVERLNELHYQARWEAGAEGPRMILANCPYAAIIARHPELCRLDSFLLEDQLGLPSTQTAKLEPTERGLRVCIFQMRLSYVTG